MSGFSSLRTLLLYYAVCFSLRSCTVALL